MWSLVRVSLLCFLLFISFVNSHDVDEQQTASYIAGALQWAPYGSSSDPASTVVAANLNEFAAYAQQAKQQGVQILVFNEGGLGMFNAETVNTRDAMLPYCEYFPSPSYTTPHPSVRHFSERSEINPCNGIGGNWTTVSQAYIISCAALTQQMILVLNTCDYVPCSSKTDPSCPQDGRYQYNAQVVFNEQGDLIAKYHKSHLFGGAAVFDQSAPLAVTFDTSLGITFGTFICFDILYPHPAETLVGMGIKHFVFSSWWMNFAPGYVATMQQQAWSRHNQVALIAANTGADPNESGGGIYLSGEPLVTYFNTNDDPVRKLLVAKLPIDIPTSKPYPPALHTPARYFSALPTDAPIAATCALGSPLGPTGNCSLITSNTAGASYSLTAQSGTLSCTASFSIANQPNETYGIFAYQGVIHFPNTIDPLSLEVCAVSQCKNQGILFGYTVCEPVFSGSTVISTFTITGSGFTNTTSIFPTLALGNAQVVDRDWLGFQEQTNETVRSAILNSQITITQSMFSAMIFGVVPNK